MAAKKQAQSTAAQTAPKFTLAALREHSKTALGVEDSVMAGAFSGMPADAEFTLDEAKARIDTFMRTPIPRRNKRR